MCLYTAMTSLPLATENEFKEIERLTQQSAGVTSHYLSSSSLATKTLLVLFRAITDTLSRHVKDGDLAVSGVDPSGLDAKVFAWSDGMAKRMGERRFRAVLLGALQRAVETLKPEKKDET